MSLTKNVVFPIDLDCIDPNGDAFAWQGRVACKVIFSEKLGRHALALVSPIDNPRYLISYVAKKYTSRDATAGSFAFIDESCIETNCGGDRYDQGRCPLGYGCTFAKCTTKCSSADIFKYFCGKSKYQNGKIWAFLDDKWSASDFEQIRTFQYGKNLQTLEDPNARESRTKSLPSKVVPSTRVQVKTKGTYARATHPGTEIAPAPVVDKKVVKIFADIENSTLKTLKMAKGLTNLVDQLLSTENSADGQTTCPTKLREEICDGVLKLTAALGTVTNDISSSKKRYDGTHKRELAKIAKIREAAVANAIEAEKLAIANLEGSSNDRWDEETNVKWADIS